MFSEDADYLPFECTIEGNTVRVIGEIDLSTAQNFKEALLTAVRDSGRAPTVDLSGVDYIDSAGIQALVNVRGEDPDESNPIRIIGVRPHVMRIFRMVGLDSAFEIQGLGESNIPFF